MQAYFLESDSSIFIIFSMSNYPRILSFEFITCIIMQDMEEDPKEDWEPVPQSKNSFGGVFEVGSSSHLIQHVK